jgi:hypothetical protein
LSPAQAEDVECKWFVSLPIRECIQIELTLAFHSQSIIAIQNSLSPKQVPVAMALAIFSQTLGSSIFLSLAQTIFTNGLVSNLATSAPGVNPRTIINAGASGIRAAVSHAQLPGVLLAYNKAINETFYLAAGASVAIFTFAWGMGWKSIKKPKTVKAEA